MIGESDPVRCPWAGGSQLYRDYHDQEWGRPLHGHDAMFERLCLEAFQSGLSWITILRKRQAFRAAFADFVVSVVADFDAADEARLLADSAIVRNRLKIRSCIVNAQVIRDRDINLDSLLWSFAPSSPRRRPATPADVPETTREAMAMAKELKRLGFQFVGPTTAYALMQAVGMVDDHLADCWVPMTNGGFVRESEKFGYPNTFASYGDLPAQ